jgi:Zn-dependent protease with chaperone function
MEAARALLPFWVVWGPVLLLPPAALVLSLAISGIYALLALRHCRRSREEPWYERARLAYPIRRLAQVNLFMLSAVLGSLVFLLPGSLCPAPWGLVALLTALAAWAGALPAAWRIESWLQPGRFRLRERLRGTLASGLVVHPWLAVLALVFFLLPGLRGRDAWAALGLAVLALAFCVSGGGLLLARLVGLATPPSDRLRSVVDRAAARVGHRPRAIHELCLTQANALAFPLGGQLIVTPAALAVLDDEELAAVCVHELGHLTEPRLLALARAVPLFVLLLLAAGVALHPAIGSAAYWGIVLGVVLVLFLSPRLTRWLERRADRVAQAHEEEQGVYARALAKVYEVNLSPAVHPGRGTTHPHLYDRLIAAGAPPTYPRPKPPPRPARALAFSFIVILVGAGLIILVAAGPFGPRSRREEPVALWLLALGGGAPELADLAEMRFRRGDLAASAALYQAASEANADSPYYPANWAIALAALDRCGEAEAAAGEAARRAEAIGPRGFRIVAEARQAIWLCRQRTAMDASGEQRPGRR